MEDSFIYCESVGVPAIRILIGLEMRTVFREQDESREEVEEET